MCAINPTHKKRMVIDCYTSLPMSKTQFEQLLLETLLETEQDLNTINPKLRFHLKESNQEAE